MAQRNPAPHGHVDPTDYSHGRHDGRRLKGHPLDHSYAIQPDGDTRRNVDPKVVTVPPRFRATCDVCPWTGEWHPGWPDGAKTADNDGTTHRETTRGEPGWDHCDVCGRRVLGSALCDEHAMAYEDSLTDGEDPWS